LIEKWLKTFFSFVTLLMNTILSVGRPSNQVGTKVCPLGYLFSQLSDPKIDDKTEKPWKVPE